MTVVDLLKEMARKNLSYKEQILAAYAEVKEDLGRCQSYLALYLQCGFVDVNIAREFGRYFQMLVRAGELTAFEPQHAKVLHAWLSGICEFRLSHYFARKAAQDN